MRASLSYLVAMQYPLTAKVRMFAKQLPKQLLRGLGWPLRVSASLLGGSNADCYRYFMYRALTNIAHDPL